MRRGCDNAKGMKGDGHEGGWGYERRGTEERHKGIWEGMWGYEWNGMEAVGGVCVVTGTAFSPLYGFILSCPTTATILDGNAIAKSIRDEVGGRIRSIQSTFPRFRPQLAVVLAGARPDSSTYVRMKAKAAEEVGISFNHVSVPAESTVEEIIEIVQKLNANEAISGILVQLPLGQHIDAQGERTVMESISPEKDVDGFHAYNIGHLSSKASDPLFSPCTPAAVIRLLEETGKLLPGAHAVVLGRSDIVGSPVASMLRNKDATVTQCHSRTKDIEGIVKTADVVVAAIGRARHQERRG
ncbi:tetrahydrofolate synthase [Pleurotus ostreatus]|nr:tetrahydrofolate synthase [Pleurotus ostreatus]